MLNSMADVIKRSHYSRGLDIACGFYAHDFSFLITQHFVLMYYFPKIFYKDFFYILGTSTNFSKRSSRRWSRDQETSM